MYKFFGHPHPRNLGGPTIWHDFGQFLTLTANILGTDPDIKRQKQT